MMLISESAPIEVDVHRSSTDGALIVQIDSQEGTGRVRVVLNNAVLYRGDPEVDLDAVSILREIQQKLNETNSFELTNAEGDAQLRAFVSQRLYGFDMRTTDS